MPTNLNNKIEQYRKDGRNLFSHSEKIVAALCHPDLYMELMPERYQAEPMAAYFFELDGNQRSTVMRQYTRD